MDQNTERSRRYWKVLAHTLHKEGRYAEALRIYRQAILMNPDDADIAFNLGNLLRTVGQYDKAIGVYEHAHRLNPQDPDILVNLAPLYRSAKRTEEARQCYLKILDLDPGNATSLYFLAALAGETPERAPAAYIVELFDQYAPTYDQHMNEVLKYRGPELLRNLLLSYPPARQRRFAACDLGCGTGRSMEAFRSLVATVDGYDLSPAMLQRAAEKKIYRHFVPGDCVETLAASAYSYELFVAADLIPYIGSVDELFAAIRAKASSPAFFLFTTEFQEKHAEPRLLTTGRYEHSLRYMQERFQAHGMKLRAFRTQALRMQADQAIRGGLYLAQV